MEKRSFRDTSGRCFREERINAAPEGSEGGGERDRLSCAATRGEEEADPREKERDGGGETYSTHFSYPIVMAARTSKKIRSLETTDNGRLNVSFVP